MKKLLAVTLLLILLLPAAAPAEDSDPILGAWYDHVDLVKYPEMKEIYGDIDHGIIIYFFTEDGLILESDTVIKGNEMTQNHLIAGRWEKNESGYIISVRGVGSNRSVIVDGCLMVGIGNIGTVPGYMRFYRMELFNPYDDYVYTPSY